MRDIAKILRLASDRNNMDFTEDFTKIKSVLEYCDDYIQSLNKVQFRGGNEKLIEEIIARLLNYFKEKKYIDDNYKPVAEYENELRKITFFLVLNTDATFKYDLSNDNTICHILNIVPQLPKCLLVHLIWGLNLNPFFYEIIKLTPCWFVLQFCEPIIGLIKYLEPYEALDTVEAVVIGIFENMCRAELRQLDTVDKKIIFNKYYDHIMEILRQFYTPDIGKFSEWSKLRFYKYHGFAIKHLLDMILYCIDAYECPILRKLKNKHKIYEICRESCPYIKMTAPGFTYSEFVKEHLLKMITALLNSLQYNVMLVTISTFMYWVEIDLTDDLNLQQAIGERAYKVIEKIQSNKCFEHDVEQQLKTISIQPKSLEETIKEATIGEILRNLENNTKLDEEASKIWFDELIKRPLALGNEECLETILTYSKLITIDNYMTLLEFLRSEIDRVGCDQNANDDSMDEDEYENFEGILKVLQESLANFKVDELIEIISYRIKLFGKSQSSDKLTMHLEIMIQRDEQKSLKERSTQFFNKSLENFDIFNFLLLCFENPEIMWRKFFKEACESEQQIQNLIKILNTTQEFSSLYIQELLNESFPQYCEVKYYVNFIFQLYQTNCIDRMKFFKEFVYKNVQEMLELQQFTPLLKMFKILLMIANKSQISLNAPVLIMSGQVLDQLRWDMLSYSDMKDEILRNCIEFIQILSKKFLPNASERDKNWIKEKVKSYRPLTQYYFQKYTLRVDEKPKTFDKFLHPQDFVDRNDIDEFLTSTYVRCTTKETEWLARNDELLPHISDVILILDGIVSELGDENAVANYRHCILNYVYIINKILIPNVSNNKIAAKELILKTLKIIELAPKVIYDEIFMIFHGVLLDIFQKSSLIEENVVNEVKKIVKSMKDCKGKELFTEKFSVMAIESSV